MAAKKFYITTTIPYVNADPHIGFAMEIIRADIIARYKKLAGFDVFFNTGTDEHGVKVYRKAVEQGKDPQAYVDEYAAKFRNLLTVLNISSDANFIRTTDKHHVEAAQAFWKVCLKAGDIYKKNYAIKYCVGCELEKTASDLVDGKCPDHPSLDLEIIEEENYFFRFSKFGERLLELYEKNPDFVIPRSRLGEIKAFVSRGLEDFSISRLASKMPWGVPVPGDSDHVMYVWFDALVNYISAIGWPGDMKKFKNWWPAVQICGKDNLRQQSAMWQAMLMSASLEPSAHIIVNGFITSGGQKMSKSLGNVIDPVKLVAEYGGNGEHVASGADTLRYFLTRHVSPFEDSDFTIERFKAVYNADLANGLGNLTARIMTLAEANLEKPITEPERPKFNKNITIAVEAFEFNKALEIIWAEIGKLDQKINETAPFKLIKIDPKAGQKLIRELVLELYLIVIMLEPFMPETSRIIKEAILANKKPANLFPRKD